MPYEKGKKWNRRRPMRKAGAVVLPKTNPQKTNRDLRFKQMSPYTIKPEPFPRVLYTRCKYADNGQFTGSLQNYSYGKTYRLNSIWDPDFTGSGKTVTGHSQLSAIYNKYLVTGAKIYVSFNNPTQDGVRCGVRLRQVNSNSAISNATVDVINQPLTYIGGINNTGSQKKDFQFFVRPWSLLGLSKLEYFANTSIYAPTINADPAGAHTAYMDIFFLNQSNGDVQQLDYIVKIVYYVQFFDRKALSASSF